MAVERERSFLKKTIDKVGYAAAFVTLPLGLYVGGTALLAGEMGKAAVAGTFAFLDFTQIREHGRPPEKQSSWNPERLGDAIFNFFGIGSQKLNRPISTHLAAAAGTPA